MTLSETDRTIVRDLARHDYQHPEVAALNAGRAAEPTPSGASPSALSS